MTDTSEQTPAAAPKGWMNRNILGMGLASLFSDWNHEMATAILPAFLSTVLGVLTLGGMRLTRVSATVSHGQASP